MKLRLLYAVSHDGNDVVVVKFGLISLILCPRLFIWNATTEMDHFRLFTSIITIRKNFILPITFFNKVKIFQFHV